MFDEEGVLNVLHEDFIVVLRPVLELFVFVVWSGVKLLRVQNQADSSCFGRGKRLYHPRIMRNTQSLVQIRWQVLPEHVIVRLQQLN